jgi:MFS family permease
MLLLSARAGALSQRIGPRMPMTLGPMVCAGALLLFTRIGEHASYLRTVLPAVLLLGLGLSLTVAPLTATALGALDDRHAGIASGVNNAVARTAALLAVAVLPLVAGIGTGSLTEAAALGPTYRTAMLVCAGLMLVGAATAFAAIPARSGGAADATRTRAPPPSSPVRFHCAVAGPPLHPRLPQPAPKP